MPTVGGVTAVFRFIGRAVNRVVETDIVEPRQGSACIGQPLNLKADAVGGRPIVFIPIDENFPRCLGVAIVAESPYRHPLNAEISDTRVVGYADRLVAVINNN
jgi:hypothetical protein